MKHLTFLIVVVLAIIPQGYGIKCNVCRANSMGPNSCQSPTQVTCPAPNDRCFTLRTMTEMQGSGGAMMKITMEMRNCTVGGMTCTEAAQQQMCQDPSIKSCNLSCCAGDLCNDGSNPPGSGVTPKPASKVSLSCYECGPEGMGPNGTGTPLISCSAPKQKKCGEYGLGMPFDRCITLKVSVKNPKTGALIEQESRNCSVSFMCSGNMLCNSMNSTGDIAKCNVQCCEGSLCNTDVPIGGQTPLAVSSILAIISIFMALLFK